MFSKKTKNLSVAVLALIMAISLGFGLFGFNKTEVNAAENSIEFNLLNTAATGSGGKVGLIGSGNAYYFRGSGSPAIETKGGLRMKATSTVVFAVEEDSMLDQMTFYNTKSSEQSIIFTVEEVKESYYQLMVDAYNAGTKLDATIKANSSKFADYVGKSNSNMGDAVNSNATVKTIASYSIDVVAQKATETQSIANSSDSSPALKLEAGKKYAIFSDATDSAVAITSFTIKAAARSYQVTYNYNDDGETENLVEEWTEGDPAIVLEEPVRTGYTFLGWSDGVNTLAADAEYTPTANVTLTAQWSYNYVKVTVDGVAEDVEKNSTHLLDIPTLEGKDFLGWSYANDNTPTLIPTAEQITAGAVELAVAEADVTLYTCWSVKAGLLIYNSIDGADTATAELATNPTVVSYETLFTAVDDTVYEFLKWVDDTGAEYVLDQAVTGTATVQLYPVFKVLPQTLEAIEVWAGEVFDIATLPSEYEGFAVIWAAAEGVADKYVGTLVAKDHFEVADALLTQTLSRFNYTVDQAYTFETQYAALGFDNLLAVLPKTVTLTGHYGTMSREQEFTLVWNLENITDFGLNTVTATVEPFAGYEVTAAITANVNIINAKLEEVTFDYAFGATVDETTLPANFSGTGLSGAYADTETLNDATGAALYNTYLTLAYTGKLVYTLPFKAYVTQVEIEYGTVGTKDTGKGFCMVATAYYADGASKATNLTEIAARQRTYTDVVNYDSTVETDRIEFTIPKKQMGIKRVKISYISLAVDTVMTLDVNGGDALAQTTYNVKAGQTFTLPEAVRAATSDAIYNFMGWLSGEKLYKAGEEFYPDADMTFVAQWDVINLNTPVTGIALAAPETETVVGGAVTYPTTVTATYGDGKTVELSLALSEGQTLVDTSTIGVYTLTYNVDNMNGFYALGEYATVSFKVTVYEWKVSGVEAVSLTVKQGEVLKTPATVVANVQKWNGAEFFGETETKEFAVTWEAFDTTQEIKSGYTLPGTLTAEVGYNLGDFTAVTADVEINNFNYSAVKSIWFNSKEASDNMSEYGYTAVISSSKGGFDNSKDDEYFGFKLGDSDYIQFTLDKETKVVIGLSGLATKTSVQFQFGSLAEDGTLTELFAITTFADKQYQDFSAVLPAGTYKLVNNATGNTNKNNVNVRYIQMLDGGSQFFIPSATTNVAPENIDKENFIGWTDGTTLYTKGAAMPAPATNKGAIAYTPFYGEVNGFGTATGYTLLGYFQESTMQVVASIDTTVATSYTAINAKAIWTDGAALRIAGASSDAAEDNSALKFVLNIEFTANVAKLVSDASETLLAFGLENAGEAQYTLVKADNANKLTINLYVEKVVSLGLANTAIAPKVSLNGSEFITANAYTAKFIAEKALADTQSFEGGIYEFLLASGAYSRFNIEEQAGIQKYIDLAPTGGNTGDNTDPSDSSSENSSSTGSENSSTGTDEPTTSTDPSTSTGESSTGTDEPITSSDEPITSSDEPITSSDEPNTSSDEPNTSSDEPNTSSGDVYTSYY